MRVTLGRYECSWYCVMACPPAARRVNPCILSMRFTKASPPRMKRTSWYRSAFNLHGNKKFVKFAMSPNGINSSFLRPSSTWVCTCSAIRLAVTASKEVGSKASSLSCVALRKNSGASTRVVVRAPCGVTSSNFRSSSLATTRASPVMERGISISV